MKDPYEMAIDTRGYSWEIDFKPIQEFLTNLYDVVHSRPKDVEPFFKKMTCTELVGLPDEVLLGALRFSYALLGQLRPGNMFAVPRQEMPSWFVFRDQVMSEMIFRHGEDRAKSIMRGLDTVQPSE